jgi:hypothetical protein
MPADYGDLSRIALEAEILLYTHVNLEVVGRELGVLGSCEQLSAKPS